MPIYGMHTKSGGRLIGQMVCLGNLSFSSFIHQHQQEIMVARYQRITYNV